MATVQRAELAEVDSAGPVPTDSGREMMASASSPWTRWMPRLVAAAGEPHVVDKLKNGYQVAGKPFKIHADGNNFLPYFKGEVAKGPRDTIYYFGQGGELNALRWNDWKISFATLQGNIVSGVRLPGRQ